MLATSHTEPLAQPSKAVRASAPPQRVTHVQQADTTTLMRAQAAKSAVEDLSASFGDITGRDAHDAPARQTSVLGRERWMPEARGA